MGVPNIHLMTKEEADKALAKDAGVPYEPIEEPKKKEEEKSTENLTRDKKK